MADPFTLAAVASAAGTAISTVGTLAAGSAQKKASDYESAQYKIAAQQSKAASQRDAMADRTQTNRLVSKARAAGAASGFGGASDVSTLQQLGDIQQEGDYRALASLYAGEEKARGLRAKATAAHYEGKVAQRASYFKAGETLVRGAGSWADKYG